MEYREMTIDEAERIGEIDATYFIRNVWRKSKETEEYVLKEINWTGKELPNGFGWHLKRFKEALEKGGAAYGCFEEGKLLGYTTLGGEIFGEKERYVLLDQLFVSKERRNQGVGKVLFKLCAARAAAMGAKKLYLCSASSEDTIAFYRKLGCAAASEINQKLYEEDPNDIQLEFVLDGDERNASQAASDV